MPKIIVEGPDGRKFAFPDTMPQSEINAFMRNKYGTKSRNETVDQYLARVVREEDATKARARDIDRRAAEAGRAEGERAAERMGVTNPLMMAVAAPAIGMAQQAGARPVYEREGTILPDEAAGLSAINAAGFFVPGMVNQRFGQRLEEGRRQEPGAAFVGDIAGGYPSGELIGLGLQKAGQAIAPGIAALGRLFQGRQSISPEMQATLQQTAVGSIGGSAYGSQNDVNNDGVIDEKDAYAGALAGGLGLPAGIKGAQVVGDLMQVPRGAAEAIPAGSNPYLNRRSMRPEAPAGPGEATQALREEWRPLMPSIAQARATAEDAIRLAEQARTPQQIEQAKAALGTLRNQVSEMRSARGGAATPEDQRIDDIIDSLQPTSDPIFMGTQASAARQSLDRLGQSLGFEQAGPRGRQAIYDEALFDLRGDALLGMNNEIKVVTEPTIAPDGTVLRKGVAEAVTGAELPISTGRAPPRTVLPRGADQPSEPRGPGRYAAGQGDEIKPQGFGAGTPKTPQQAARFETPNLPTYKANPQKGQGFDEWVETLYSDAVRGPDNKTVLPNVFYRGMSDAEFEAAQKTGKFQSLDKSEGLYVEKDPTRYSGGGAYGAKRSGVIVQFDTTGLTPKTIRARAAGGFAEDGFNEIPNEKIARVWKWDATKNDHVLVYEAPPNTPQQAARFETPGSPEYEAAVAKGLDMSTPARMARAREMGFDTDKVFYHGTDADIISFRTSSKGTFGEGVYLAGDAEHASLYADGPGGNVLPVYVKGKIATAADIDPSIPDAGGGIDKANDAYRKGFAGYLHRYTNGSEELIVFNPRNIRSVNAAFDPDKATSSTLLAAAPFAAVGGAGMTAERELGARMKEKGD